MHHAGRRHRIPPVTALAGGVALVVALALTGCSSSDPAPDPGTVPATGGATSAPGTAAPGTTAPPRSGTTQTTLPRPSTTAGTSTTVRTGPTTPTTPTTFTPGPIEPDPGDPVPGIDDPTTIPEDESTSTTEPDPEVVPSDFDLPFPTTSEP